MSGKVILNATVLVFCCVLTTALSLDCSAKKAQVWTIEARQTKLMQEINAAQKAKELTQKEAEGLRSDLADVSRRKAKFKAKSDTSKLSKEQQAELEERLNKISTDLHKLQLEKRVKD